MAVMKKTTQYNKVEDYRPDTNADASLPDAAAIFARPPPHITLQWSAGCCCPSVVHFQSPRCHQQKQQQRRRQNSSTSNCTQTQ
jgi:hypothetical protein